MRFVATTSRGLEQALADELIALGMTDAKIERSAVLFSGPIETGYRACLWSRIASRILLVLRHDRICGADDLYDLVASVCWTDHLGPDQTIAVDFVGGSSRIRHSQFGARVVKDAIVDQIREKRGARPSVELRSPDIQINLHLREPSPHYSIATLCLDLSGLAMHLRGSGRSAGKAPLKENLAAALLQIAGWPAALKEGRPLLDPMSGSGTFVLEAASMALDQAPGLLRKKWGFNQWFGHDASLWSDLHAEAKQRFAEGLQRELPVIAGGNIDRSAMQTARENAMRRQLDEHIQVFFRPIEQCETVGDGPGILVSNPPYGVRMGDVEELKPLYRQIGDILRHRFLGWDAWLLCGETALIKQLSLRPKRKHVVLNGAIECRWLHIPISDKPVEGQGPGWR